MWSLAAPLALLLAPLPLLVARLLPPGESADGALRVPPAIVARLAAGQSSPVAGKGRVILFWLMWFGIVVALADPRMPLAAPALPASGREIMLALDLSGSMANRDFTVDGKPARRVDALKRVAKNFIRQRAGDRVGLVVFAELAYVVASPSFDVSAVSRALEEVDIGLVGRSTAIGEGLGLALKRLSESNAPSRVVILLSDGVNNTGTVQPLDAARLARTLGVRIHTIALGLHDLADPEDDPDAVDAETLKAVAEASGGTAFRVRTTEELEQVSRSIDQLESGRALAPPTIVHADLWIYPASLAFFAALASLVLERRRK